MPIIISQNGGASYYLYPFYYTSNPSYTNLVAHMPMMISQKRAPAVKVIKYSW